MNKIVMAWHLIHTVGMNPTWGMAAVGLCFPALCCPMQVRVLQWAYPPTL
jgi:hypothetical protein